MPEITPQLAETAGSFVRDLFAGSTAESSTRCLEEVMGSGSDTPSTRAIANLMAAGHPERAEVVAGWGKLDGRT